MKPFVHKKLGWGIAVLVLTQVLGDLPMLDFLPQNYLKLIAFFMGVLLTVAKGVEMFFAQLAGEPPEAIAPAARDAEILALIKDFGKGPQPGAASGAETETAVSPQPSPHPSPAPAGEGGKAAAGGGSGGSGVAPVPLPAA
jgi:hypothetical protein